MDLDAKMYMSASNIVSRQQPRGISEKTAVQFILNAQNSLWHKQAQAWISRPPLELGPLDRLLWKDACQIIGNMIDAGYDERRQTWWYVQSLGENSASNVLTLMAFGDMLKQYKHQLAFKVNDGFWVFLDLACGREWEKRYAQFIRMARKGNSRANRKGTPAGETPAQPLQNAGIG